MCKGHDGCECLCRYNFKDLTPEQKATQDRKNAEQSLQQECPICHMSKKFHSSSDVLNCKAKAKQLNITF
jgi:hypothetical protein